MPDICGMQKIAIQTSHRVFVAFSEVCTCVRSSEMTPAERPIQPCSYTCRSYRCDVVSAAFLPFTLIDVKERRRAIAFLQLQLKQHNKMC